VEAGLMACGYSGTVSVRILTYEIHTFCVSVTRVTAS
jgi:hypothetical protein